MIRLQGIEKIYTMGAVDVPALRDVDLEIQRGEFIAVVGPSGSGKSTLLHILGGLDLPTAGQYLLEDVRLDELSDKELSRIRNQHFGFVFQSYHLLPELKAWENVALPLVYSGASRKQRREKAIEYLEKVELGHRINHYPTQLSGGEQQRVALARSLVNKPTLLLGDEPTGNLATKQGMEILDLFAQLNEVERVTVVLVTHDPRVAERAPRLIELKDGRIDSDTRRSEPA